MRESFSSIAHEEWERAGEDPKKEGVKRVFTPEGRLSAVRKQYLDAPGGMELFAEECMRYVKPIVWGMVRYREALRGDAGDIVQNVVFKASRNLSRFNGDCSLQGWVSAIALHEVQDWYRREHAGGRDRSKTSYIDELLEQGEEFKDVGDTPEEIALRESRAGALYEAIENLSEEEKLVVRLHWFEDYTIKELAGALDANENTIKTRIFRAKEKVKSYLERHHFGP